MFSDFSKVELKNIEVPIEIFKTNSRIKNMVDELFSNNSVKLNKVISDLRESAKKTHNINYGNLTCEYLVSRFKFYFCKSIAYQAAQVTFLENEYNKSYEENVMSLLTNQNFKKAMYGEEMYFTFSKIDFEN